MSTLSIRSTKPDRKTPAPQQPPARSTAPQKPHPLSVSPGDDLHILTAKRAYERYSERGYRHGSALDDWLEAEREVLSQIPSV
jgi:DUF2934 family protein